MFGEAIGLKGKLPLLCIRCHGDRDRPQEAANAANVDNVENRSWVVCVQHEVLYPKQNKTKVVLPIN